MKRRDEESIEGKGEGMRRGKKIKQGEEGEGNRRREGV